MNAQVFLELLFVVAIFSFILWLTLLILQVSRKKAKPSKSQTPTSNYQKPDVEVIAIPPHWGNKSNDLLPPFRPDPPPLRSIPQTRNPSWHRDRALNTNPLSSEDSGWSRDSHDDSPTRRDCDSRSWSSSSSGHESSSSSSSCSSDGSSSGGGGGDW